MSTIVEQVSMRRDRGARIKGFDHSPIQEHKVNYRVTDVDISPYADGLELSVDITTVYLSKHARSVYGSIAVDATTVDGHEYLTRLKAVIDAVLESHPAPRRREPNENGHGFHTPRGDWPDRSSQ